MTNINEMTVNWRDVFSEMSSIQENAIILKETRQMAGLTQKQLSELTGIQKKHISEMENAKHIISKDDAKKLAIALNIEYRILL